MFFPIKIFILHITHHSRWEVGEANSAILTPATAMRSGTFLYKRNTKEMSGHSFSPQSLLKGHFHQQDPFLAFCTTHKN